MTKRLPHFTRLELCHSVKAIERGIDNAPPESVNAALAVTLAGLERVRAFLGDKPMIIDSGYRCRPLNQIVGGSDDSQHCKGEAVDFRCPQFGTPREIALALSLNMEILGIDQLILEPTWVHMSFSLEPRYQVLHKVGPKRYLPGLG